MQAARRLVARARVVLLAAEPRQEPAVARRLAAMLAEPQRVELLVARVLLLVVVVASEPEEQMPATPAVGSPMAAAA